MGIDDIPEEVLLKIFKYLPLQDIIFNVKLVCDRWLQLTNDISIWRDSVCTVDCKMENKDVINFLKQAPRLRHIELRKTVSPRVFVQLYVSCPKLTTLEIDKNQTLPLNVVKNITSLCVNLKSLSIHLNIIQGETQNLSKLKNLEHLIFKSHDYSTFPDISLHPIGTFCHRLKQIDIDLYSAYEHDLQMFLAQTKGRLLSLRIRFHMSSFDTSCVIQNNCDLKELYLLGSCNDEVHAKSFEAITKMKHLKVLSLKNLLFAEPQHVADKFYYSSLASLSKFELYWIQNSVYDSIVRAVCSNCPLIEELIINQKIHTENILLSDYGIELLPELKHLHVFELSIENGPTNIKSNVIGMCKRLKKLKLHVLHYSSFFEINRNFGTLNNMVLLELEHCDLKQINVPDIPTCMPILTSLNLFECIGYCDDDIKHLKNKTRSLKVSTKYSEF